MHASVWCEDEVVVSMISSRFQVVGFILHTKLFRTGWHAKIETRVGVFVTTTVAL